MRSNYELSSRSNRMPIEFFCKEEQLRHSHIETSIETDLEPLSISDTID